MGVHLERTILRTRRLLSLEQSSLMTLVGGHGISSNKKSRNCLDVIKQKCNLQVGGGASIEEPLQGGTY